MFLLLDEVPCNSDSGSVNFCFGERSGNWTGLRSNGVNLMIALKPIDDGNDIGLFNYTWMRCKKQEPGLDLCFSKELEHLELCRIYRCTQRLSQFYEAIISKYNTASSLDHGSQINKKSKSYTPGHEIIGECPEVLLLPKCTCSNSDSAFCFIPQEHLLVSHKTKIFALLRRIQRKFKAENENITVIIKANYNEDTSKCVEWIETELKKNLICNFDVKTIGQCRGMEFPILVSITDGNSADRVI